MVLVLAKPDTEFVIVEDNFRLRPVDLAMPVEQRNFLLMLDICRAVEFHERRGLKFLQRMPTHTKYPDKSSCRTCGIRRLHAGQDIPFVYHTSGSQQDEDGKSALDPNEQIATSGKVYMSVLLHFWERQVAVQMQNEIEFMKSLGAADGFQPIDALEPELKAVLKGEKYDDDLYH